jgi:hypothetical protein
MDIELKTSSSWRVIALCVALGLVAGFLIGRKSFVADERVRTAKAPTVEGVAERLTPVEETWPSEPLSPSPTNNIPRIVFVRDTALAGDTVRIVERVDTAAIIRDYETRRKYSELLFDRPDLGRLNIEFGVQYNRADSLRFSFTPVRTEITRYAGASIEPFALMEYSTLGRLGVGGGLFYGKWGALAKFETDFTGRRGVGVGLAYRF